MKNSLLLIFISFLLSACEPVINRVEPLLSSTDFNSASYEKNFAAHWLEKSIIVLPTPNKVVKQIQLLSYSVYHNINVITLSATNLPSHLKQKRPHLSEFSAYHVDISESEAKKWLKEALMVVVQFTDNTQQVSYVQTADIIDELYTSGNNDANEVNDLGVTVKILENKQSKISFKLWAPTAHWVNVLLLDQNQQPINKTINLIEDTNTGIWHAEIVGDYHLNYYQYELNVYHPESQQTETLTTTDPYSLSLSSNSKHSQIIDLSSPITMPDEWHSQKDNKLNAPEDAILYETHVRDFSASEKNLSNNNYRGKYKAFSETNSDGINHLIALKEAGLNHIHLLPVFDIGTINEESSYQLSLDDSLKKACTLAPNASICHQSLDQKLTLRNLLTSFNPKTGDAQALISELRADDNYNWGYDPFHYSVPEGSYAVNANGHHRIVEFREMVQSLHNMGFRVIMDVVYNHTHQAGLKKTSVLDKIVPTYYQRLHPTTGKIEQSTCCDNTATEHVMMEKLMIDSLIVWARDYKIDGFRFDLMAHQPKSAMLKARQAVQEVDPDSYFYGEGWNFGEVANNQQFIQASQLELAGTEIGTFTDRLRDAVRGNFNVSGFDTRKNQGIGNGLGTMPNEIQSFEDKADYQLKMDQLRIGLAANLANFPIINSIGQQVTGKDIPYGGQPTGYALDPADTINYVSKHDNQTLWDNSQYRIAFDATTQQRVRMHNQSLSYALLAQGIPFLHMGSELLRSKSFLRDSYDYSDWFNAVDFSLQSNNYNVGLPPKEKDEVNWPLIKTVLSSNQKRDIVTTADIKFAAETFKSFMTIRNSSPLFRLTTEQDIIDKVSFLNTGLNQKTGVIAMLIDDKQGSAVINKTSDKIKAITVVFNNNPTEQHFEHNALSDFTLHPIQANGHDKVTQQSKIINKSGIPTAIVPALTTAIFVKY